MLHEIAASDLDISTKAPHGSECIRQHPFGSIQASPQSGKQGHQKFA
jgi:hypothetical protein